MITAKNTLKSTVKIAPPRDFTTLKQRIDELLGRSIGEIAGQLSLSVPATTLKGKGFTGELMEICLGASSQSAPEPDFPQLELELKTMPVDVNFTPLESTFIAYAPVWGTIGHRFEDSYLYRKIQRILWVFIYAPRQLPLSSRVVAGYYFWSPPAEILSQIRRDFEEIYELINSGRIEEITAELGEIIQLRPKAANGKALTQAIGPDGDVIMTRPRGFYLRRNFTKKLVDKFRQQGV